jgi:copper homeostasis protein
MIIEICTNGITSSLNAQKGGANRIELCDNLLEGGTTPSLGMIEIVKKQLSIDVFVMIRPRGGDFLYSDLEFEIMKNDILRCKEIGVEGVVFGILNSDGTIDKQRTLSLIEIARPMQVTFHRAFDRCNNLQQGLEDLIELGIDNVLTSGGNPKAIDSLPILEKLVQQAGNRINIMVGSGVNPYNVHHFKNIGITNFHFSATTTTNSPMTFRSQAFDTTEQLSVSEFELKISSAEMIQAMRENLK